MAIAGTVSFVPKGEYNEQTTYKRLNTVRYQNKVYVSLKTVVGVTPSDDKVNWMLFVDTTEIDPSEIAPEFSVAATRENIMAGESLPTLFGKIKKYFTDLKGHAFNDTVNNLTTSTTGSSLDASQGKVLQGEVDEINSNLIEQKMLGWTVPRECPIQNEVNGNQFIQKVGRADMSKLSWSTYSSTGIFRFSSESGAEYTKYNIKRGSFAYSRGYNYVGNSTSWSDISNYGNKTIMGVFAGGNDDGFILTNNAYTNSSDFKQAMQGQYLYYELATYNTMTIDGNEEVVKVAEDVDTLKKETTVNLLNPTLQTTTQNGVTCTNNGDGTYTLNGTATNANATFDLSFSCSLNIPVKLLGRPKNIDGVMIQTMYNGSWDDPNTWDTTGNGAILSDASKINRLSLFVLKDKSVKNAIIKPMITTNLDATYDDFVPYTGDTGSLNGDVAKLKNDLCNMIENKSFSSVNVKSVSFNLPTESWNCGTIFGNLNNGGNFKYDYYVTTAGQVSLKQIGGDDIKLSASISGRNLTIQATNDSYTFKTITIIKS